MKYIVELILGLSYGERGLYIALLFFLAYRGLIVLPFIPIGKKYKEKKQRDTIIEKLLKIWDIKTKQTLYEQMNVVESYNASITFKMNAIALELGMSPCEVQHYELLVEQLEGECKSFIRKWAKENHYTSRTETEFDVYISQKIKFLVQLVTAGLNKYYRDDFFTVTRKELKEYNTTHLTTHAKEEWTKMFRAIREVSRTNEARIKELEDQTK